MMVSLSMANLSHSDLQSMFAQELRAISGFYPDFFWTKVSPQKLQIPNEKLDLEKWPLFYTTDP